MSIRGISFGNIFTQRDLRFDSQRNYDISFEGSGKKTESEYSMIKYGFPKPNPNRQTDDPPMVKYAIPSGPRNNYPIWPIKPEKNKESNIENDKPETPFYAKYGIPRPFND